MAAGSGLTDHLEIVLQLQDSAKACPDQRLVVHDQHPDHATTLGDAGPR
jgi:hypothetical protein